MEKGNREMVEMFAGMEYGELLEKVEEIASEIGRAMFSGNFNKANKLINESLTAAIYSTTVQTEEDVAYGRMTAILRIALDKAYFTGWDRGAASYAEHTQH